MTAIRNKEYANLGSLQEWADAIMTREPDFIVGENYLRRWWIIPRNEFQNIYLHEFRASDDDRAMHDHPWDSTSFILRGSYIEHTKSGSFVRTVGDISHRKSTAMHRIELINNQPCVSLFTTGAKVRDWGFDCPQGWKPWQEFVDPDNPGRSGPGCN